MLAAALTIGVFFLIWAILQEGRDEAPWITAGIAASVVLGGAVFLREIVLRNARNRFLAAQRRLDRTMHGLYAAGINDNRPEKLTLEKNAAVVAEIRRKSEAAKVLGKFSEGHREVFDLCDEYIAVAERELPTVGVGSPRIAALSRGMEYARERHRFHMLQWAEIEARSLTQVAKGQEKVSERLSTATKALDAVELALEYYPLEENLGGSRLVLKDFIASIKVSNLVEKAERAGFKGNHKRALRYYQDALFFLDRETEKSGDLGLIFAEITERIESIKQLQANESNDARLSLD